MTFRILQVSSGAVLAGMLLLGACTSSAAPTATTSTATTSTATTSTATTVPAATSSQPPTTIPAPPAEHKIQVRVVDGKGKFYDTQTGERFVPRGMNYNRLLHGSTGRGMFGMLLSTTRYDRDSVEKDLSAMEALGFNVVRVLLEICGPAANGCVAGPDGYLSPRYIDNLTDFLTRAKAHGIVVMVASNTLPDDGYWINAAYAVSNETFGGANNEFLNPRAVPIYVNYWRSLVQALVERGAPLDAIWAYELRQEHSFSLDQPPLSLDTGLVTTANGETYDMANPQDKNRMIDEGITYWADTIRAAILDIDPTALVTVGFFVPSAPNPVMDPGDPRFVRTAYFLANSTMDFFDLHHYPGNGVDDAEIWENFGIAGIDEKPLVLGEFGAYKDWFADESSAAAAVMGMQVASCRVGFDGWLVWSWRGDLARDIWWASDGDGEVAKVVSPRERPDLWHAIRSTPQWIDLALSEPADIDVIRLTVAQDPRGSSRHELWVRRSGSDLEQVHVFDGVTGEGDVLTYEPSEPLTEVELVRVLTTRIAGGLAPAWHEIELLTRSNPD